MIQRRQRCLDDALQRMLLLLWPRFKAIIDLHMSGLRDVHIKGGRTGGSGSGGSNGASSSSLSFDRNSVPTAEMVLMTRPHALSGRYAELTASLWWLNREQLEESIVLSLRRVRSEVRLYKICAFLLSLSCSNFVFFATTICARFSFSGGAHSAASGRRDSVAQAASRIPDQ
jgi:hypothetical protein